MHMKKLPSGEIIECTCASCRTWPSAEELLNPMQSLPKPARWYVYAAYAFAALTVIGTFVYVYFP